MLFSHGAWKISSCVLAVVNSWMCPSTTRVIVLSTSSISKWPTVSWSQSRFPQRKDNISRTCACPWTHYSGSPWYPCSPQQYSLDSRHHVHQQNPFSNYLLAIPSLRHCWAPGQMSNHHHSPETPKCFQPLPSSWFYHHQIIRWPWVWTTPSLVSMPRHLRCQWSHPRHRTLQPHCERQE